MTIYRIRSRVLRNERQRIESVNRSYVEQRLKDVQKRDPDAKIITIGRAGR